MQKWKICVQGESSNAILLESRNMKLWAEQQSNRHKDKCAKHSAAEESPHWFPRIRFVELIFNVLVKSWDFESCTGSEAFVWLGQEHLCKVRCELQLLLQGSSSFCTFVCMHPAMHLFWQLEKPAAMTADTLPTLFYLTDTRTQIHRFTSWLSRPRVACSLPTRCM